MQCSESPAERPILGFDPAVVCKASIRRTAMIVLLMWPQIAEQRRRPELGERDAAIHRKPTHQRHRRRHPDPATMVVVVVGVAEFGGALMLLVPRLATLGGCLLALVMLGAVATHLVHG